MRHGVAHRKLNRTVSHRKAMLANMAASLIEVSSASNNIMSRPYSTPYSISPPFGPLAAPRRALVATWLRQSRLYSLSFGADHLCI